MSEPRSVDQVVRDTLGNLQLQIAQLTAEVESLRARLPPPEPAAAPAGPGVLQDGTQPERMR